MNVAVEVTRGPVVESRHQAIVAVTGPVEWSFGEEAATTVVLPRSATKPLQAIAMLRSGLDLEGHLLALAAASHLGEPFHLAGVVEILDGAGLSAADLQNTPDLPIDKKAQRDWLAAGAGPARIAQNCSGKHAAMLRTCHRAGWPTASYLTPQHPLQQAVRAVTQEFTGDDIADPVIDGCGAPAFAMTLAGLARTFGRIAAATDDPEKRLADAYRAAPLYISGTASPEPTFFAEVPGLICKGGAEAIFAAGLPDGTGIALKMLDGMGRGRTEVMAAVLGALGAGTPALDALQPDPVLGHGKPVGEVRISAALRAELATLQAG